MLSSKCDDFEAVCKQLGYDFDGLHVADAANPTDHYSVAYSQFIMPLVKAVQEQQVMIDALQSENAQLRDAAKQMAEMKAQLEAIQTQLGLKTSVK